MYDLFLSPLFYYQGYVSNTDVKFVLVAAILFAFSLIPRC